MRFWRAIRLALRIQPLQTRNTTASGTVSSAALSSSRLRPSGRVEEAGGGQVRRERADPEQPVERVADAQRLELPGLLEQPLHAAGEAQDRDQEEEEADDAQARVRARGRREDVGDRRGAASGQLVAVDDAVGRASCPRAASPARW